MSETTREEKEESLVEKLSAGVTALKDEFAKYIVQTIKGAEEMYKSKLKPKPKPLSQLRPQPRRG